MGLKLLSYFTILVFVFSFVLHLVIPTDSPDHHYDTSCPKMPEIVKSGVKEALRNDSRIGASLLRLHFLDCFVNGCDASILLDDTETFKGEKNALPNRNSARGYEVIDHIKTMLEESCPSTVSCADILAQAARESVVLLGGPNYPISLGRRDGLTADATAAYEQLPSPFETLDSIISKFNYKNFNFRDVVALAGGHTVGFAQCSKVKGRLYKHRGIPHFPKICPNKDGPGINHYLVPLDVISAHRFDNAYYRNLVNNTGVLQSDQGFMMDPRTVSIVHEYSTNPIAFFSDFATAIKKLGNIGVLKGENEGQIRKKCGSVN